MDNYPLSDWVCRDHLEKWLRESEAPSGSDPSVFLHKQLRNEVLNGDRFERARRLVGVAIPQEQDHRLHAHSRLVANKAVEILKVPCCCVVTDSFWSEILNAFRKIHGIKER